MRSPFPQWVCITLIWTFHASTLVQLPSEYGGKMVDQWAFTRMCVILRCFCRRSTLYLFSELEMGIMPHPLLPSNTQSIMIMLHQNHTQYHMLHLLPHPPRMLYSTHLTCRARVAIHQANPCTCGTKRGDWRMGMGQRTNPWNHAWTSLCLMANVMI
jgi:hypothetical protein